MLHVTCSLHFNDGQVVAACIEAKTKIDESAVTYSGPIERLPVFPTTATAVELRAYFFSFARELGAVLKEDVTEDSVLFNPEIDRLFDCLKKSAHKKTSR